MSNGHHRQQGSFFFSLAIPQQHGYHTLRDDSLSRVDASRRTFMSEQSSRHHNSINRRTFLAGAAATTLTVIKPELVRGSDRNSKIKIGMIGCGGRGKWIIPLFNEHGGYEWSACADYYPERAEAFGEMTGIPADRRFSTLSGFKRLLETDIDAVIIESPPYFHPEHAAAAVDAGKHVFLAKPIAVDVPGCLSIDETGKRATRKKLVMLVDFQTRANKHYQAAAARVHNGEIGKIVCGEARYPWAGGKMPAPRNHEETLARWYCIKELSGDFIVEQSIHAIDVANWMINAKPTSAIGTARSKGLRTHGNIMDTFNLLYQYPDDVALTFYCVQAVPKAPNEIVCRVYASKGLVETDYLRKVSVRGTEPSTGGECGDLYRSGAVENIKTFHEYVTTGQCKNQTVEPSVTSNLTAILGRMAGYEKSEITWNDMIRKAEKYKYDLSEFKT
jgi:predicted dehydrogenase